MERHNVEFDESLANSALSLQLSGKKIATKQNKLAMQHIWQGYTVCLTGSFICAPGKHKRLQQVQQLIGGSVTVTKNWSSRVDLLVIGGKANKISHKVKQAVIKRVPMILEQQLLDLATNLRDACNRTNNLHKNMRHS